MAVDPEPPVQIDMTESGDSQLSSVLSQQKTFSFSSFASSSIFAKPRQRKIKKKATTINKYARHRVLIAELHLINICRVSDYQMSRLVSAKEASGKGASSVNWKKSV